MKFLQRNSMKTLEKSEKALKQTLYEKGLLIESEKNELKKLLSYEKIKGDRMQILASDIKEEYMRKNAFLMQELLNKDETIKKLTANMIRTQIIKDLIRNHDKIIQEKETERTQEKLEIREILDKSSESKENKDFYRENLVDLAEIFRYVKSLAQNRLGLYYFMVFQIESEEIK